MSGKAVSRTDEGGGGINPNRYTTIELNENQYGEWEATQDGVDLVGVHENAAMAVAEYAEQVARQNGEVEIDD